MNAKAAIKTKVQPTDNKTMKISTLEKTIGINNKIKGIKAGSNAQTVDGNFIRIFVFLLTTVANISAKTPVKKITNKGNQYNVSSLTIWLLIDVMYKLVFIFILHKLS